MNYLNTVHAYSKKETESNDYGTKCMNCKCNCTNYIISIKLSCAASKYHDCNL